MTQTELKQFKSELQALLKKYNVHLETDITGDTYGFNVNGINVVDSTGKEYRVKEYSLILSPHDL